MSELDDKYDLIPDNLSLGEFFNYLTKSKEELIELKRKRQKDTAKDIIKSIWEYGLSGELRVWIMNSFWCLKERQKSNEEWQQFFGDLYEAAAEKWG